MARFLRCALPALLIALFFLPVASAQGYEQFRSEFDKATQLGAKKRQDDLMKRSEADAIYAIIVTAEAISNAPNDILYDRYQALRDTWTRVFETNFPEDMEVYFANLDPKSKAERRKLRNQYEKVVKKQLAAQAEKDAAALIPIAAEMVACANAFQELGDRWFESQALLGAGVALDEQFQGKKADLRQVCGHFERAVKLREEVGVKDILYKQTVPRLKSLQALGFGSGPKAGGGAGDDGVGGGDAEPAAASAGSAITAKMTFELFKGMDDMLRPSFYLDDHFQVWPAVNLGAVKSSARFPRIPDGPTVFRPSASKVMVDTDGDGEGDTEWPTRGKLESLTVELGSGASKRPWAVFSLTGRQEDFYQGQQLNLLATDASYQLYHVPAGAMVGELAGVKVQVVDDDMDGVYGTLPPLAYQNFGLAKGVDQLDFDSIRVDGQKKAGPFSEFVNLGSAGWHKIQSQNGGNELVAEPYTFKTGSVQLKGKGAKPEFFILRGTGEVLGNTFIDVSGGKKVDVPVGRYELVWGLLRSGKKMQVAKATIRSSSQSGLIDVLEGETTVIPFGQPYKFDFEYENGSDSVTVAGSSVVVVGAGGEVYDRFYQAVPNPEGSVRKAGSKRGSSGVRMRPAQSNDEIDKFGWAAMWKPLDAEISKKKGEEVEVQLTEKKNTLFGKIESDWK